MSDEEIPTVDEMIGILKSDEPRPEILRAEDGTAAYPWLMLQTHRTAVEDLLIALTVLPEGREALEHLTGPRFATTRLSRIAATLLAWGEERDADARPLEPS